MTNVFTKEDIQLIAISKENGVQVTCDVNIYNMFFSKVDFDSTLLGNVEDVSELWKNLPIIDCFSIGSTPYLLGKSLGHSVSSSLGIEEAIPLLVMALEEGKLTLADIKEKLHDNPVSIFGLPTQKDTYIEIEIDRKQLVSDKGFENAGSTWSPVSKKFLGGFVHRVVIRGETVYLDGSFFGEQIGRDVSSVTSVMARTVPHSSSPIRRPRSVVPETPLTPQALHDGDNFEHLEIASRLRRRDESESQPTLTPLISKALPVGISSTSSASFYKKHITSVNNFSRPDLHLLFSVAQELRNLVERGKKINYLDGKVMCSAFWEPSTRTSSSFESAMYRMGGSVVSINQITSSVAKGESMADTGKSLEYLVTSQ